MSQETWPTINEPSFNQPPLEAEQPPRQLPWRGVRLGAVSSELYFEVDGVDIIRDLSGDNINICSATGKPPEMTDTSREWLYKHHPSRAYWDNMLSTSLLSFISTGVAMPEVYKYLDGGLTNAVPIEELAYEKFYAPQEGEEQEYDTTSTVTIAVSYVHKTKERNGLLKANEFQVSQLRDILQALKEYPPPGVEYVRLWTDQALSQHLSSTSTRPPWILLGLLPYTNYPVASLFSEDDNDLASMWTNCEQLLGDGGSGLFFFLRQWEKIREKVPKLMAKDSYCGNLEAPAMKTIGDALSVNRNLERLSQTIHAGVLDECVTFHIADAVLLVKLAYYMTRISTDVSLAHVVFCGPCLDATCREHVGFLWAIRQSADVYDPVDEDGLIDRINKTGLNLPYPKVRARRGYVDWHGVREFLPGAGKLAKGLELVLTANIRKHLWIIKLSRSGVTLEGECFAVQALPKENQVCYIVLYVAGQHLFDWNARVWWSMRLNIRSLEKLHNGMQTRKVNAAASELFRHPRMNEVLEEVWCNDVVHMSTVKWNGDDPLARREIKPTKEDVLTQMDKTWVAFKQKIGIGE